MEWSKIKNIIILLLLVLNLLFLLLVGYQSQQGLQIAQEAKSTTLDLLEKHGIQVEEMTVPWSGQLVPLVARKDEADRMALAGNILGTLRETEGGGSAEYNGNRGRGTFQEDGRVMVALFPGAEPVTGSVQAHAKQYLKQLGVEAELISSREIENKTVVTLYQTMRGNPVFTCEIQMEYQLDSLTGLQGQLLLGVVSAADEQQPLSVETLMVRFMNAVLEEQLSCTQINAITQGYLYETGSLTTQPKLIPVWQLETDGGTVFLNCLTGELG